MINSIWRFFLIVITILGLVVAIAPWVAIYTIIFPPLFLALAFMPSIALYLWLATLSFILFRSFGKKMRYIITVVTVIAISLAVPFVFNLTLEIKAKNLIKDDIELEKPLPMSGVLAYKIPSYHGIRGASSNKCPPLCQRLLYNRAFDQIMVYIDGVGPRNFYLESRAFCPALEPVLDTVALRVADGECLIESLDSNRQPDFIYRKEHILPSGKADKRYGNARTFSAVRLTVIDNRIADKKIIYQKTAVKSHPLVYPFMSSLGGGIPDVHLKLMRSKQTLNAITEEDTEKLFGKSGVADIEEGLVSQVQTLNNYLDKSSGRDKGAKQLFDGFWIALDKKASLNSEETALVTRALNDDRVNFSYDFPKIIRKLNDAPDELVLALGNRILRNPSYHVSNAIMALPEGRASVVAPQLERLARDEKLSALYWGAVSRLGDGSDNAVYQYMSMLKDYQKFLSSGNALRDVRKKEENVVLGAILGLCRLGEKASVAKKDLYSILETGNKPTKLSRRVIRALSQIVGIAELEDRYLDDEVYKNSNRVGREIKRYILDRERFKDKIRGTPCT